MHLLTSYPPFPRFPGSSLSPPLFSCHDDDVKLHHRFSPVDGLRGGATQRILDSTKQEPSSRESLSLRFPPPAPTNTRIQPSKMREIVHLQAGQCGNQIGAKVLFWLYMSALGFAFDESLAGVNASRGAAYILLFKNSKQNILNAMSS